MEDIGHANKKNKSAFKRELDIFFGELLGREGRAYIRAVKNPQTRSKTLAKGVRVAGKVTGKGIQRIGNQVALGVGSGISRSAQEYTRHKINDMFTRKK